MLKIGPYEIYSVINGYVRLDGGAMFGVVPKVLWQDICDVDEKNRILLSTRTLIAVNAADKRVILVDTGCGTKWLPKAAERFGIQNNPDAISEALKPLGLTTDDVTDIVVTHLHFDHNGGVTKWYDDPGGKTELRYPQARHWIHKNHLDHATNPHPKDRASFLEEDFNILMDSNNLKLVEGDDPAGPFDGLSWFISHGHTPYQLHPIFSDGDDQLLFVGDIVPTMNHLRQGWVMAYDVSPMITMDEKAKIYQRCFEQGLKLAFPHDPKVGGVTINGTIQRPIVVNQLDL